MIHVTKILVIIGSTRPRRISPQVAEWVTQIGREAIPEATFEIVDLRDWPLPMDDESDIPARGPTYETPATTAWSRKIQEGRAFVFVTPQYNWGYPAALKNALDHLFHEWNGKPAVICTYGGRGGGRCAEQLRQVLQGGLDMKPVATAPGFTLPRTHIEANPGMVDAAAMFAGHVDEVKKAFGELKEALKG